MEATVLTSSLIVDTASLASLVRRLRVRIVRSLVVLGQIRVVSALLLRGMFLLW